MASLLSILALLTLRPSAPQSEPERPPNVVVVMADDLGWNDTTLSGASRFFETPALERLARSGMLFTRAHAASAVCSPTRASLLTGLAPARTGFTLPVGNQAMVQLVPERPAHAPPGFALVPPLSVTRLDTRHRTLAEALSEAGYATAHFGKWHLGAEPYSAREHGFALDVPHWSGASPAGGYLAPWEFPGFPPGEPGEQIDERLAREAVAFLEAHREEPFFLQFWPFGVHAPFEARPELVERFRARRAALEGDPSDGGRSPTYAAMVASLDQAVGILLDGLEGLGLAESTIVVFTSDNGGNDLDELDGTTPTHNRPLRSGKGSIFEGGLRVPLVVRWPGVVPGGSRSEALVQTTDLYPTLLEMLGLAPAEGQRFDGVSLVPALRGQALEREAIFTFQPQYGEASEALPPCVAVQQGDWKLIRVFHGGEGAAHRYLLFDLARDPGESSDRSAEEPERVRALDARIERWLAETGAVLPVPNPRFDPDLQPEDGGRPEPLERASAAELQGWAARSGQAFVRDGVLALQGHGLEPFLARRMEASAEAATLVLFVRCGSSGEGRLERLGQGSQAFALGGGEWQRVEVRLEPGAAGVVRLHLPARAQKVELDWIELRSGDAVTRWDF